MKNHKQIAVDSNFVINNYKNYATERKTRLRISGDDEISGESRHITPVESGQSDTPGIGASPTSIDIKGDYAVAGERMGDTNGGAVGANQGRAFVFKKSGDTWSRIATLEPADAESGDYFGQGCAISANGTYVVVGADLEDDAAGATNAGRIYIFKNNGSDSYTELAQDVISPNPATEAGFGFSVAIDGDHIIVGEPFSGTGSHGKGHIFKKNDGADTWSLEATITGDVATGQGSSTGDQIGRDVDITSHGDKKYAIISTPFDDDDESNSGAAWVYELPSGGSWTFKSKLKASDAAANDRMGFACAIHEGVAVLGTYLHNSAAGAVYVFERDASTGKWGAADASYGSPKPRTQNAKLTPASSNASDRFGMSVDIDGTNIVVGAAPSSSPGSIHIFQKIDGTWTEKPALKTIPSVSANGDKFGDSVGISGTSIVVGSPDLENALPRADLGSLFFYKLAPSDGGAGEENPARTPKNQPPFSLLTPGIHSLRRK